MPSLKNIESVKNIIIEVKEDLIIANEPNNISILDFENIKEAILKFANHISGTHKIIATILINISGEYENEVFRYKTSDNFEKSQIELIKPLMLKFLKESFGFNFTIEVYVDPNKVLNQTVLTASDKLKLLIEEFPIIADLQAALDLKIEY